MVTRQVLRSDLAIPPGEYLVEVLEDLEMSQADLARRMGRPSQAINEIVHGKKAITPETAIQLEKVTGVPAHVWTGLEEEYRLILAQEEEEEFLKREAELVDVELYRSMAKLGWVSAARRPVDKARVLCNYFGVASLAYLGDAKLSGYAFRIADREGASSLALAAWLRRAELSARSIETEPYDATGFMRALTDLRAYTLLPPGDWQRALRERLATVGVALVVQPHLPKTFANGATFWTSPDKAVVVLSLRGAWADIFWFTLFHELGHVKLHGKRDPHVSIDRADDPVEVEANRFARDTLIPSSEFEEFLLGGDYSERTVEIFSERVGIASGVVVGRLQHEKLVPHNRLNHLREKLEFVT